MARVLANVSTFTFQGLEYQATSVTVEAPQPEIVNMTSGDAAGTSVMMVPTGAWLTPGSIEVEAFGLFDPASVVGQTGPAVFSTQLGAISRGCVCSAASVTGQVGDLLRVRFTLLPTDYVP